MNPYQRKSNLESILQFTNYMFTNYMKSTLKEVRFIIHKFQKNMARYYNRRYTFVLVFCPSNSIAQIYYDIIALVHNLSFMAVLFYNSSAIVMSSSIKTL